MLDSARADELGAAKIENSAALGMSCVLRRRTPRRTRAAYDLAVLSPGIDPKTALVQNFLARGIPIIAEIELAYQNSSTPVIGITGTNGKTTTTELVAAMLTGAGMRTVAGGNIGKPYSEIVSEGRPMDVITLEVSSFQLERIQKLPARRSASGSTSRPTIWTVTRTKQEYRNAKLRIFENQTADDWAVVNFARSPPAAAPPSASPSARTRSGADLHLQDEIIHYKDQPLLDPRETHLRGRHNTENLMAALGVGLARGLTPAQMGPALRAYRPQPHRCELVRELDGVDLHQRQQGDQPRRAGKSA